MNEDWIEIEGRNTEEALERACNALNTNRTHMEYETLSDGAVIKIRARKVEKGSLEQTGEENHEKETRAPTPPDPELGRKSKEVLEALVKFIDDTATVEMKEEGETIHLEIFSDNAAVLIGKYGLTLGAIQYLVTKMLGLDRNASQRILIDSEQYRERRRESLESLAQKLASRARRTGRPVSADPMNAADRRVIHMALAEDSSVTTKSIGEGLSRKVLIVPKNERRPSQGQGQGQGRGRGRGPSRGPSSGGRGFEREEPRRAGPPRRMHDSFDAPPEPAVDFFDDDDDFEAPLIERDENGVLAKGNGDHDDE